MRRPTATMLSCLAVICVFGLALAPTDAQARPKQINEQRGGLTAKQAAAKAKAQYGGKVLKVTRKGNGYRVRLLQQSGRVITVVIGG